MSGEVQETGSAAKEKSPRLSIPMAIIAAGAIIAVAIVISNNPGNNAAVANNDGAPTDLSNNVAAVTASDHILGNPNADVFLIEYSDFECPFCQRFHATGHSIINEYGVDGNVAWVLRNFPIQTIHPGAPTIHLAAECVAELAGNEAFWSFSDNVFATPSSGGFDLSLLPQIAASVGVDPAGFELCMAQERHRDRIQADLASGAAAGVTGTPHTIVLTKDGQTFPIRGAQSTETVRQIIELALDTL